MDSVCAIVLLSELYANTKWNYFALEIGAAFILDFMLMLYQQTRKQTNKQTSFYTPVKFSERENAKEYENLCIQK